MWRTGAQFNISVSWEIRENDQLPSRTAEYGHSTSSSHSLCFEWMTTSGDKEPIMNQETASKLMGRTDWSKSTRIHTHTHTQLREKKNTVDSSGLWQRSFRKSRVFGIDWNEAKAFNAFSEWCIVLSSLWQFQTRLLRFVISLQTLPSINNHIYGKLIWGK